jgi:hypothetical protein
MECLVYRVPMRDPGDASGITRLIDEGALAANEILAIFGKTEGNGCVNDFTRGYALSALSAMLAPRLGVAADAVPERVAMVMSGGTEGGLSPHFLVFAARARRRPEARPQGARDRHGAHREATSRVNRPRAAGNGGGRGGPRGHGARRDCRRGRRPLGPGQMSAADQRAGRRGGGKRPAGRDCGHLCLDGAVARRVGARRRAGARRDRPGGARLRRYRP